MTVSPSNILPSNDTVTVIAVGTLAATLAAVFHETLGHGIGCIATGGHISLLTSIWFRCSNWSVLSDVGGPIGNLVAGSVALALLKYVRLSSTVKLFLLMCSALNLFWLMGQLTFESLINSHDDWYDLLHMGSPLICRTVGTMVGIGGYLLVRRLLSMVIRIPPTPQPRTIRLAYIAAASSAVIAGLMWQPEPVRSAIEGLLTLGIAPFGLLGVARTIDHKVGEDSSVSCVSRSWIWIVICVVLYGGFLFVQARGFGAMAAVPLSK